MAQDPQFTISNHKCCTISIGKSTNDSFPYFLGTQYLTVQEGVSDLGVVVDSQQLGALAHAWCIGK